LETSKKYLLSKHVSSNPTLEREIQQYRCLSIDTVDDVLSWWSSQQQTFERWFKLALVVFGVPATSAPSERLFSVAGITLNATRSRLARCRVDKILFVHANVHFMDG
jgi:hypothetical protein